MICPNCNATDHEAGAKYCHKCGSPLSYNNSSSIESSKPQNHYKMSSVPNCVKAVDLGLPSGTRWANMNIGAISPEKFGDYYAWGEVSKKTTYTWQTYTHCDGTIESCRDIGSNICGTQYDVAHVKWGGKWQLPTSDQVKELIENCRYEWTKVNGVNGGRFIGPNGNSIFLPAAGYRDDSSEISPTGHIDVGYYAEYWSGTQNSPFVEYAFCLTLFDCGPEGRNSARGNGNVIRPVEVS